MKARQNYRDRERDREGKWDYRKIEKEKEKEKESESNYSHFRAKQTDSLYLISSHSNSRKVYILVFLNQKNQTTWMEAFLKKNKKIDYKNL